MDQNRDERVKARTWAKDNRVDKVPAAARYRVEFGTEKPPLKLFRTKVYAQWSGDGDPAEELRTLLDLDTVQPAPPGSKWVPEGGKKWGGDHPKEWRLKMVDPNGIVLVKAYLFKATEEWYIIEMRNFTNGEEEEEEEDVSMDFEVVAANAEASLAPLNVGTVSERNEDGDDLIARNITCIGRLLVLSDENTKTDISTLVRPMEETMINFLNIRHVKFTDSSGQQRHGHLAGNIANVYPGVVAKVTIDREERDTIDFQGYVAEMGLVVQDLLKLLVQQNMNLETLHRWIGLNVEPAVLSSVYKEMQQNLQDSQMEATDNQNGSPSEMSVENVGKRIAKELGEINVIPLTNLVKKIGVDRALKLMEEVRAEPPDSSSRSLGGKWFFRAKNIGTENVAESIVSAESLRGKEYPYQLEAIRDIGEADAILSMPTGKGKTLIACRVIELALKRKEGSFAIFITQDRELCKQQATALYRDGPDEWHRDGAILLSYGQSPIRSLNSEKEWQALDSGVQFTSSNFAKLASKCKVVCITAGALWSNVLKLGASSIDFSNTSIAVFDEAHHAGEGLHNFVKTADILRHHSHIQLLGMSASPVSGSDDELKLTQALNNLQQNLRGAKIVNPVMNSAETQICLHVRRADSTELEQGLVKTLNRLTDELRDFCFELGGSSNPCPSNDYGSRMLEWARQESIIAGTNGKAMHAGAFFALFRMIQTTLLANDIGAEASRDVIVTNLLLRMHHGKCKEVINMICEVLALEILPGLAHETYQMTKCKEIEKILSDMGGNHRKVLIRVATKRGVFWLAEYLRTNHTSLQVGALVGRADMNEKTTNRTLEKFKQGNLDVIVGTSLVEEGLDLKDCDTVIAFSVKHLINSGKSLIQNAGRARREDSKMFVLCDGVEEECLLESKREQILAMDAVLRKSKSQS